MQQIRGREAEALRGLTAVDGALLTALPKMVWALWVDDEHRAVKMHRHFDVLKGAPVVATLTEGNGSETPQLRATLQADRPGKAVGSKSGVGLFTVRSRSSSPKSR